jgi:energy-coupling factor transport system permease protein
MYYYYVFSNHAGLKEIEMAVGSITKFTFAISAAFAVAVSNHAGLLAIVFLVVLTAFISWGGSFKDVFRIAGIAFWFFLLVFLLHLFSGSGRVLFNIWILKAYADGFESGLFYGMKLIVFVYSAYIIFFKVDPSDLIRPLERTARYLGPAGRIISSFLLSFSLALRFLPELSRQAQKTMMAFKSRGFEIKGGIKNRVKVANMLLVSIFVNTFEKAESVSIALNIRGYPLRYRQAVFPPPKISLFGLFVFVVSIGIVCAGWMSR